MSLITLTASTSLLEPFVVTYHSWYLGSHLGSYAKLDSEIGEQEINLSAFNLQPDSYNKAVRQCKSYLFDSGTCIHHSLVGWLIMS